MIAVEQIRAARAMLDLKQTELAKKAGISVGTLNNIERGFQTDPKISTLKAIQSALTNAGIEFTEAQSGALGVILKEPRKTKNEINILIIDDSDADRKLYRAWLNKQTDKKYNITEATNAKEGYEAFLHHKPDCILLDFMMYGKDGFQLLVEMKKEHSHIPPIIFITAMNAEKLQNEVLAMGVQTFLDKRSLTKEKLYEAIQKALV